MIFEMPAVTFFAILSWPVIFTVAAFVVYNRMAKQDALIDDSEYEPKSEKGGESK